MISESLDHAFDDMNAAGLDRSEIESRRDVGAVEVAFERMGDAISTVERDEINSAAANLREALHPRKRENCKLPMPNSTGATQELAASIVERAMQSADHSPRNLAGK